MTTPKSVVRWPQKGQFWAWKNPLSLTCISATGDGDVVLNLHQWKPDGEDEIIVIQLSTDHAEYLWWEQRMSPPATREKPLMVGDILIARTNYADGRFSEGRLLFIGPETTSDMIHVLATWEVCDSDLLSPVYQYGPGHMARSGKTAYDHVLEGAL
jgi:hypothetical protein